MMWGLGARYLLLLFLVIIFGGGGVWCWLDVGWLPVFIWSPATFLCSFSGVVEQFAHQTGSDCIPAQTNEKIFTKMLSSNDLMIFFLHSFM